MYFSYDFYKYNVRVGYIKSSLLLNNHKLFKLRYYGNARDPFLYTENYTRTSILFCASSVYVFYDFCFATYGKPIQRKRNIICQQYYTLVYILLMWLKLCAMYIHNCVLFLAFAKILRTSVRGYPG